MVKKNNFETSIQIAKKLLYNDDWDEELQESAVELLFALKKQYPTLWSSNWIYEAFLGNACNITLRYDERYNAYSNANNNCSNPPPKLLIELARCYICPGSPPINLERSINLLKKSIDKHPFKQAALLLSDLYALNNDNVKKNTG